MILDILKRLFAAFLRSRAFGRHFRRLALLETITRTGVSREPPPGLARELIDAARTDTDTLFARLDSHPNGLSHSEVEEARERAGPNEVEHEKPLPWSRQLWLAYRTPFSLLLTFLAVISYVTGDLKATIVIGAMVVLATAIAAACRVFRTSSRHPARLHDVDPNNERILRAAVWMAVSLPQRQ